MGIGAERRWCLTEDQIKTVMATGSPRGLPAGAVLYKQGSEADYVYLLLKGRVKAVSVNVQGSERMLRVHLPGSLLGLTAISHHPQRDATATAMEDCQTYRLTRAQMLRLMEEDARFGIHIAQLLLERLESFQYCAHEVLSNTVEQRIARALLQFSEPSDKPAGAGLVLRLTHEELAQIVAARRPTVTQVLNMFAASGLIALERRRMTILAPQKLSHILPDAPGAGMSPA